MQRGHGGAWRSGILAAVAGMLSWSSVGAQGTGTLEGRITAVGGTDGLAGVTVSFTGTNIGTITRADGSYRVPVKPGTHELRVRMFGYASKLDTVVIEAARSTTRNYALTKSVAQLDQIAVTGSRAGERTVVLSPVPVDVINTAELRSTGRVETAQMLQAAAPSLNFPRPAVADGTDHVRPATLRGLAPDQTLVLVNGKRRYTSALINNNGTIGRGTSAVDLNAIPASMIERIEILRDGAAAQYGSDAIAGVINIILKGSGAGSASLQAGQFNTDVEGLGKRNDGSNIAAAVDHGLTWGSGSYVHGGFEYRNRAMTNRSFADPRVQYAANDPREATANRFTHWSGDAASADVVGMFNAAHNLANGVHESNINDLSVGVGARGKAKGWSWDLSQVYGRNSFQFIISNSNNASLGAASPTTFDAGTLGFGQALTNLDLSRVFTPGGKPFRVSSGAEFRLDSYTIAAGEEASYINGGSPILDAAGVPVRNASGATSPALPGSQVFPGFTPKDATDQSRTAVAAYIDLETDLSKKLLLGFAGRMERFSDFGSKATGKLSGRFALTERLALRGAVATGFRAPSLQQSFFTSQATTFVNGLPVDIKTLPVASREARLLGARELKPENSVNLSGGVTMQPTSALTLTADYYDIAISDRIVLSENFIGAGIQTFFAANGFPSVNGGRYFTNAIDTRTRGLDVVANYGIDLNDRGVLRLTAGYNQNRTKVTKVVVNTPEQLGNLNEQLFGQAERGRIEVGQPRNNLLLTAAYDLKRLTLVARAHRFGEVTSIAALATGTSRQVPNQTYSAKVITDLAASYRFFDRATITLGSDNAFDVYPDQNKDRGDLATNYAGQGTYGVFRYSGLSPFGFNGRYLYARASFGL